MADIIMNAKETKEAKKAATIALMANGKKVRWGGTCTPDGRRNEKRGEIICIVPAGVAPFVVKSDRPNRYILPDGQKVSFSNTRYGGGAPRAHASCIVRLDNGCNGPIRYYWPLVSSLTIE
jgi:hypothetical protein